MKNEKKLIIISNKKILYVEWCEKIRNKKIDENFYKSFVEKIEKFLGKNRKKIAFLLKFSHNVGRYRKILKENTWSERKGEGVIKPNIQHEKIVGVSKWEIA